MAKNLLSEDKMKELAKSVGADEVSFVNYFKIFQNLYDKSIPTSFANYFNKVSLFDLGNINKIKNEDSFLKAISTFINEVTCDKKKIFFELSNEESIQKVLKVLKALKTPKKYVYYVTKAKPKKKGELPTLDIDFAKNKEIFELMDKVEDKNFFSDFVKKAIEEQIDVARIYYANLDELPIDKVIDYSTKYPNRIKELYAFEYKSILQFGVRTRISEFNSQIFCIFSYSLLSKAYNSFILFGYLVE